ncbi:hypothetical protein [Adhaeribacter arboris]|uniref:hypothetical protein n=1 Tax=Adhaeribacter arboris TaxID=2072846 RepID=UPI001E2FB582|nr:hypothetical protein [Adhaeribacter arboris]
MATENTPAKKPKVDSYDISKSDETLHLATDLAKFIKENKLYQNIQGKEFVNVEGWQYAGSRLGIVPIAEEPINISIEGEIKYKCNVKLFNLRTQQIVGAGFAMCSNKEQGKKFFQEYAIASMCQTRAIGKAYRNLLAWIIRAAGYEPTPSEEMDFQNEPGTGAVDPPKQVPITPPVQPSTQPESTSEGEEQPQTASKKYATQRQKEEIIRLLNNPVITRQEKTKMLLNINKLDVERADQAIAKLKKVIVNREEEERGGPAISEAERTELIELMNKVKYDKAVVPAQLKLIHSFTKHAEFENQKKHYQSILSSSNVAQGK